DLPDGVRDVIRRRIDPLSKGGRHVLATAAVVGRDFEAPVVARVVDLPLDAVLRELAPAVELAVIERAGERPGAVRLAPALVQDALGAALARAARARLHRAAATVLEAMPEAALGDVAHHYFEAAPLGTLPRAIECATHAGQQAYAQLGYEEAAGHFERALQAC